MRMYPPARRAAAALPPSSSCTADRTESRKYVSSWRARKSFAPCVDWSIRLADTFETAVRPCPSCGTRLEWLEPGTVAGVEYDYYRWCEHGCGLYCYQRSAPAGRRWVKLV